MGIFPNMNRKSIAELFRFTNTSVPRQYGNSTFYPISFVDFSTFWDSTKDDYLKQFIQIPELNAVINMVARAAINIRYVEEDKNGEEIENGPLSPLLIKSNWYQNWNEFLMQSVILRSIYGEEFIYPLKAVGFKKTEALFSVPPKIVDIDAGTTDPYFLLAKQPESYKYKYKWNDKWYDFEGEMIFLNDNKVDFTEENYMRGKSKLSSLQAPIKNIASAYETRQNVMKSSILGIFTSNTKDGTATPYMNPDEKQKTYDALTSAYGMTGDKRNYVLSALDLSFQETIIDARKLRLTEGVIADFVKICDAFGTPYELYGSEKGTTFENLQWSMRRLYQDAAIPQAHERVEGINAKVADKTRIGIRTDHIAVLQENEKNFADSKYRMLEVIKLARELGIATETIIDYENML